jgi:hypothetical protein
LIELHPLAVEAIPQKVKVRVDEARHDGSPAQIDNLGSGAGCRQDILGAAHRHDPIP